MTIFRQKGVTDAAQDFDDFVPTRPGWFDATGAPSPDTWIDGGPPLGPARYHYGCDNFEIVGPSTSVPPVVVDGDA